LRNFIYVLVLCLLIYSVSSLAQDKDAEATLNRPVPANQWSPKIRVLLGRSCVGEAGWYSGETQECAMLGNIYAKQAKQQSVYFATAMLKYSYAIKADFGIVKHPWLDGLHANGKRPRNWPRNLRWSVHRPLWKQILDTIDSWYRGEIPNPIPDADHFGGGMDVPRAELREKWKRLCAPRNFRNRYYDSRKKYTGPPLGKKGQKACYLD